MLFAALMLNHCRRSEDCRIERLSRVLLAIMISNECRRSLTVSEDLLSKHINQEVTVAL